MALGHYRWGRRARLTAGASIAIGLRESHKPDAILDISYLIDESPNSLSRAFTKVTSLLRLDIPSSDTTVHLPGLQSHLHTLIHPTQPPSILPSALLEQISTLPFPSVMRTAASLCTLVARLTSDFDHLTSYPTACAVLILSLEAEVRTSLYNLTEIARLLAGRFGLAQGTVLKRYKVLYDLIEEWVREVPWLDQFHLKSKGRSKVAKRIIVARGIKDVVQFQEEIRRQKMEAQGRVHVELELEEGDERSDNDTLSTTTRSSSSAPQSESQRSPRAMSGPARKRRKLKHRDLDEAFNFLLNPLCSSLPAMPNPSGPPPSTPAASNPGPSLPVASTPRSTTPLSLPLMSYLLTAAPSTVSLNHQPTRLQLLVAERAGEVEDINDDELFVEGELEGFLRSEAEVKDLEKTFNWYNEGTVATGPDPEKVTTDKDKGSKGASKVNRVHMDVFAKVLQGDLDDDQVLDVADTIDFEIEAWRPLSPAGGGYNGIDQYDEEY